MDALSRRGAELPGDGEEGQRRLQQLISRLQDSASQRHCAAAHIAANSPGPYHMVECAMLAVGATPSSDYSLCVSTCDGNIPRLSFALVPRTFR